MDKQPNIKRNKIFKGNLNQALHTYLHNDPSELAGKFWALDPTAISVEHVKETNLALAMLKKHLPQQFHTQLRVALPKTVWQLHVADAKTLQTLKVTIPKILLPITQAMHFAPEIMPVLHSNNLDWAKSGPILKLNPKKQRFSRSFGAVKVLQQYIPEPLQANIRFSPPKTTWIILVEKNIVAERVKALLFTCIEKIADDLGFEPTIRIAVQPSHLLWRQSGFPLAYADKINIDRPSEAEAQDFLNDFIKK